MKTPHACLAIAMAMFLPLTSFGWDVPGHVLVAKIAYDNASPNARKKMEELCTQLKYHDYTYTAVSMAGWADEVKHDTDSGDAFKDHFGGWHFIDMGLNPGDPDPIADPPTMSVKDGDVIQGIRLCLGVIKNHKKSELVPNEAVALALLVHLVGDLHQPLHCTTNYLDQGKNGHKPKTDIGGNAVTVTNFTDQYEELHQFWDEAYKMSFDKTSKIAKVEAGWNWSKTPPTIKPDNSHLVGVTSGLLQYKPTGPILLSGDYIVNWANETHQLGKTLAYGGLHQDYTGKPVTVDDAYTALARETAQKQVCLAGYRLAAILNELYP